MSDPDADPGTSAAVEVHLIGVPVPLWAQTQERTDELLREFALITEQLREQADQGHIPARLTELVEVLTARFGGISADQEARLATAAETGEAEIEDLVYWVPAAASEASAELQAMLDEADAYCLAGQHLLTLASPPDIVRFRNWYLEEFIHQIAGEPPTAWAAYKG